MSLWGPALEAEIEYRQAEVKKAWGARGRAVRTAPTGPSVTGGAAGRNAGRAPSRAEQIRKGIAGMRPAATTSRRGLFA